MKKLKDTLSVIGIVLLVIGIVVGIGAIAYLDYLAYFERYPDAAGWTYFFQRR
jgi:hypothetical protein